MQSETRQGNSHKTKHSENKNSSTRKGDTVT